MSPTGSMTDDRLLAQLAAAPPISPDFGGAQLTPGTVVAGTYRIEARVGQGGMGVVYRAQDLALDRPVALKLHVREDSDAVVGRLMREAQAMAKLSHPNVLTIYEIGYHRADEPSYLPARPQLFIAMEFIDGGTLRDWCARHNRGWRELTRVFIEAGRGLAAAHRAGVIHRDFKPDNVLIDGLGRARVADFGLARADNGQGITGDQALGDLIGASGPHGETPSAELLTTTGTVLG
ncbi:MAG: serine/threonine protein kinase, partial [Deltaproteobacteria bacterium]|nr:serine/threonine protein kinase [Deltaproteobacteria bacterium]